MSRRTPTSTRNDTRFPDTTLYRARGKDRRRLMAGACVALLAVVHPAAWGAPPQEAAARDVLRTSIDAYAPRMAQVAHEIWENPELGYLETRASKLLQDEDRKSTRLNSSH